MDTDFSRRLFLERAAHTFLGVTAFSGISQFAKGERGRAEFVDNTALPGFSSADSCIYLFMSGGMSHLDTFDPKPGQAVMGKTGTIKTKVTGEPLADTLPHLAKHRDKFSVIRTLGQQTGDHAQGSYIMRTSYSPRPDIRHPAMGAWAQHLQEKRNVELPDSVTIRGGSNHPNRGFLPPATSPLPILDPEKGVPHSQSFGNGRAPEIVEDEYGRRLELMNSLDSSFREKFTDPKVKAYTELYNEALKFMKSKELEVFDISLEPDAVRERYGNTKFGQGCLLAKRLVKAGIRFVDVQHSGWDSHSDNFTLTSEKASDMDRAVSNLLADLKSEGLLERTLVVIATEFGRTPNINANDGRDHHPRCFSGVLAGAGVTGGSFHGTSDETGNAAAEEPTSVDDFNATIAHSLGINLNKVVYSPSGRPFTVAAHTSDTSGKIFSKGQPLTHLFAG